MISPSASEVARLFELVLATRNKHKVAELASLLAGIASVRDLNEFPAAPVVEETGSTFVENAVLKAEAIARYTGLPALADDSGLEVDALGGAPGVFSARYAGPQATDEANRQKLLAALSHVPVGQRGARFACAIALAVPGRPTWTAVGYHRGSITLAPAGTGGFGYDPIFYSPELGATFAEVPQSVKNGVSHRARALAALRAHLVEAQY